MTRGIRLNNPGNLKRGSIAWNGMADDQPDPTLLKFKDPLYGLRAMALVLLNYQRLHKLRNIEQIIGRYAPPSENPTDRYIDFVCKATGYTETERVNLTDRSVLFGLIWAIIRFENANHVPYSEADIYMAIDAALNS